MRLLLVEDDRRLAQTLAAGFAEEGFEVEPCKSGQAAVAALGQGGVDVCVLDLGLPDLDGLAVLKEVRAAAVVTPILILTARDGLADRVCGLDSGADDYLVKPFAFAELLARVRALLRRTSPPAAGPLRWAGLELDPLAHEVRSDGLRIDLSAKQFALLAYLLRQRGRVVPRTTLLSAVFDYHFDPGTNLIDVHIAQLRRKLQSHGHGALIQTIRGVGYRVGDGDREGDGA
jgi:two-component system OmpR family response regulator